MAFCDFCQCENCQHGTEDGKPCHWLSHAPTADGRWICDVCWQYDVCDEHNGKPYYGPCEDEHGKPIADCPHRPKLVGPWEPVAKEPA